MLMNVTSMLNKQHGFSLPETLFALLLFAIGLTALLHYQRALLQGFAGQWQQREAWRYAAQRLNGYEKPGWKATLHTEIGPSGCRFLIVQVASPAGRQASLSSLHCEG